MRGKSSTKKFTTRSFHINHKKDHKMLYIYVILIANLLIIVANIICALVSPSLGLDLTYAIILPPISTVAVIALDAITAFIIRQLPEKWFSFESSVTNVSKEECAFYTQIGIRKWRTKIPDLGMFTGFHKNKLYEPNSNEYVRRYILEANYGVVIHIMSVPLGFLIILLCPIQWAFCFGVPVALVNAALNLLPAATLRYNTPKLMSLMRMNDRRSARDAERRNEEEKVTGC